MWLMPIQSNDIIILQNSESLSKLFFIEFLLLIQSLDISTCALLLNEIE